MSATKNAIPLDVAQAVADRLIERFAPVCERIEIAGSIRRAKATIGDIELVAIPKTYRAGQLDLFGQVVDDGEPRSRLDDVLDELLAADPPRIFRDPPKDVAGQPRWGRKYKCFWLHVNQAYGHVQVDLFAATPENWGAILAIRTGPAEFGKLLQAHIKNSTPYRQQDGMLIREASGEVVPVPEEADYFRLAGAEWIPPAERNRATLRRAIYQAQRVSPPSEAVMPAAAPLSAPADMQAESSAAVDAAHQSLVLDLLRQHGPLTLVELVRHARRDAEDFFIGPKLIPARDRLLEAGQIEQDGKRYRLAQPTTAISSPSKRPGTQPVLSTQIKAYLQRHGPSTRGALWSALDCDLPSLLSAVQALKLLGTVTELFGELRLAERRPGIQGAMGYADIDTRRMIRARLERSAGLD